MGALINHNNGKYLFNVLTIFPHLESYLKKKD